MVFVVSRNTAFGLVSQLARQFDPRRGHWGYTLRVIYIGLSTLLPQKLLFPILLFGQVPKEQRDI